MPRLSVNDMQMVIDSLEYKAQNEAGLSFGEGLFKKEDTEEWELAKKLKARLKKSVSRPPKEKANASKN